MKKNIGLLSTLASTLIIIISVSVQAQVQAQSIDNTAISQINSAVRGGLNNADIAEFRDLMIGANPDLHLGERQAIEFFPRAIQMCALQAGGVSLTERQTMYRKIPNGSIVLLTVDVIGSHVICPDQAKNESDFYRYDSLATQYQTVIDRFYEEDN